jgi:hypothetical protein
MTRCNKFKSAVAQGDVPRPMLSQPLTGFKHNSAIQHPQGVAFADDTGPPPVDCDIEDVYRMMLLTEAGYSNSDYMLKPPGSFVSLIIPHGHHFATPSDDPDDSLPADLMPLLPHAPPTMTSTEPTGADEPYAYDSISVMQVPGCFCTCGSHLRLALGLFLHHS